MKWLRWIFGNLVIFLALYIVIEVAYSGYCYLFALPTSFWTFEHPGRTIQFDSYRGFFLTTTPSRYARITRGVVEYVGTLQGNAQGFPDRDDFSPARPSANQRRYAVLGDSFTAAQYIQCNWPDKAEDLYLEGRQALQLLNFSIDGGGLANWASIIRNILAKDRYQLDGLIFAVHPADLYRKFFVADQIDSQTLAFGRVDKWDIAVQPKALADARQFLKDKPLPNTFILSSTEFDAALLGHWRPPRKWEFRITSSVWQILEPALTPRSAFPTTLEPGQLALIKEIRRFADEQALPILVVYIPNRDELLRPGRSTGIEMVKRFSEMLGAKFLDGRQAFRGLSRQQIKACWLPYDGHWNQLGSDRFAQLMSQEIRTWPPPAR